MRGREREFFEVGRGDERMIYASVNEMGVKKFDWLMSLPVGAHFVTRRPKPQPVGKERAVCSGRGKPAGCYGRVVGCELDEDWCDKHIPAQAESEAALEGFKSWDGLWEWINRAYKFDVPTLYRIEQVKIR